MLDFVRLAVSVCLVGSLTAGMPTIPAVAGPATGPAALEKAPVRPANMQTASSGKLTRTKHVYGSKNGEVGNRFSMATARVKCKSDDCVVVGTFTVIWEAFSEGVPYFMCIRVDEKTANSKCINMGELSKASKFQHDTAISIKSGLSKGRYQVDVYWSSGGTAKMFSFAATYQVYRS